MGEYLAPGVYVEDFESGGNTIESIESSTAGFIGMAQRGPTMGRPALITSVIQYRQLFGDYLEKNFTRRYLSYGVEQFFANGGSSCYVMRVVNEEDQLASAFVGKRLDRDIATPGEPENIIPVDLGLTLQATSVGEWGNQCRISLKREEFIHTEVDSVDSIPSADSVEVRSTSGILKNASGFVEGDLVKIVTTAIITKKDASDKDISEEIIYTKFNVIASLLENQVSWEKNVIPEELTTEEMQSTVNAGTVNFSCTYRMIRIGCKVQVDCDGNNETYNVTFNPNAIDTITKVMAKSLFVIPTFCVDQQCIDEEYLTIIDWYEEYTNDVEQVFFLTGGTSCPKDDGIYQGVDGGPGKRTGIASFLEVDDVSVMAIPGVTDVAVQLALIAHCENLTNRFAILDMPKEMTSVSELQEYRENFDTSYAAIYHPWLNMYDALQKTNEYFPPSAAMAGVYARVDTARGVHKAPANEVIRNCVGLSVTYNETEQAKLNPKGINLFRPLPGMGIRVWGARTMSSDGNWKYLNVRRLFIFIEQSIYKNTGWAVFEPNDANLWIRVESTIRMFLNTMWRNGALSGGSEEEAFFVNVGTSTMTSDDILNGRLICVIGIAPVRPAEFVIFRITQKMQDAA